ncbi:unnamed protein product [Penicillium salamii]|uniref:Arginosuccinase n=1 Tax=Penicillium salamii TaxID=1612424 RepID=A0A9W4JEX3_9EURO|nr:unnamed protein product [Penicillium salamii]
MSDIECRKTANMFAAGLDPLMMKYNRSIDVDRAIWRQDIRGSIAWARANMNRQILSEHEFSEIIRGFDIIKEEWENEEFPINFEIDEDIYTANERRLGEVIGIEIAGKLHTGRSRNEQSAADHRMWLREALESAAVWLKDLIQVIISRAEREIDYIMPGYTHLQRAQPVRWSQWLLGYGFSLSKDLQRLHEVLERSNESPYGCGAIAGNAFGVDRNAIASELGFTSIQWNSMEAVGDRYFSLEAIQWAATVMLHLSRFSEDLILYSTAEFHFVQLSDAYSTGSSLMPQKKNADSLELVRGKSGEVFGNMSGLMYTIKGLPSSYNKDLQGSLSAMISSMMTLEDSIRITSGVLRTLTIFPDRMRAALSPDMLATDLADYLVRKGAPFRETHHISGQIVALAENENVPMNRLSFEQINQIDGRFEEDVMSCFDYEKSVESRNAPGGTSRSSIVEQISVLRNAISG